MQDQTSLVESTQSIIDKNSELPQNDKISAKGLLQDKRVLLAEDNSINQLIAVELLSSYGMKVVVAQDGLEALKLAFSESFDLIRMDIQMPGMDGLEATRRIREDATFNDLPIIAMTAHAMFGDYEKSIQAGMQAHITKPIDPHMLYTILLYWIGKTNKSK